MKFRRIISTVCAAAVMAGAGLSEFPAHPYSAYAYAAATFYSHTVTGDPITMSVKDEGDGTFSCGVFVPIGVDGVTLDTTTVGELKEMYAGITVNGFKVNNISVEGLAEADIHTAITILSGESWDGWDAVYDTDTFDFTKINPDNDSKPIRAISLQVYLEDETIKALGLKSGDIVRINYDETRVYYEHDESAAYEMEVTEKTTDGVTTVSCEHTSNIVIPGVTLDVTTVGELKEMYEGINVKGYFTGSTLEGLTESDLELFIVVYTGTGYIWNSVYNKNPVSFSEMLANVPDSDAVRSVAFQISVKKESIERLGLKVGDAFTVNPTETTQGDWKPNFVFNKETGELMWDKYVPAADYTGDFHYEVFISGEGLTKDRWGKQGYAYYYPGFEFAYEYIKNATDISGDFTISVKVCEGDYLTEGEVLAESDETYAYSYDGCDVLDTLASPTSGFLSSADKIYWTMPEGEIGSLCLSDEGWSMSNTSRWSNYSDWGVISSYLNSSGASDTGVKIYAIDANGDISKPYITTYLKLKEARDTWKADFQFDEKTGYVTFNNLAPDENRTDDGYDRRYSMLIDGEKLAYTFDSSMNKTLTYKLPISITRYNLEHPDKPITQGEHVLSLSVVDNYDESNLVTAPDTLSFNYSGGNIDPKLGVPTNFRMSKYDPRIIEWDVVDGAAGYICHIRGVDYDYYMTTSGAMDYMLTYWHSLDFGPFYYVRVCSVDAKGNMSEWSEEFRPEFAQAEKVYFDDNGTLCWDKVEGAVSYRVRATDGTKEMEDYCIDNYSINYKVCMSQLGFAPGTYTLDVYAVFEDYSEEFIGSVEYDFIGAVSDGDNQYYYSDNPDGTITITGANIVTPELVIPSELDGKKVTEIGTSAFYFNYVITSVVIPEGVKKLGWYAFNTCENLEKVTLPKSLEYIDSWAFERCKKLKSIDIPANVTVVRGGAFAQNDSMTAINCDPDNKNYVSVDGILFTKDMTALVAYPGGIKGGYTVPASVNHIGDAAFYGALGLSSVRILGVLDFIGFEAFAECSLLENVVINEGVEYVGYWAFRGCSGIKQLTVPQSVINIGDRAFGYADYDWTKIDGFTLRGYKDSAVYYYAIRHDIPFICIGEASGENQPFDDSSSQQTEVETNPDSDKEDRIDTVIIVPAFNMKDKSEAGVGLDLSKIKVKAKEIYDEEGLARAEEALGEEIVGNKHYNLLDLTLMNGDTDISNSYDGLVKVVIPIPAGHRDKEFYCYRLVDGAKELIPGKREGDNYVVYLEHFSVYALVADDEHTCVFSEDWANDINAHWHECTCGKTTEPQAHTPSEWLTDTEAGYDYKECTVCGYILEKKSDEKTAKPVISPVSGTRFSGSLEVTITADEGAVIYYTTDGTDPTENSTKYEKAFTITSTCTVKAIAFKEGMTESDIASADYTKKTSSSGGSGGSGGYTRPAPHTDTVSSDPKVNGESKTWYDISEDTALKNGGRLTVDLNGNTEIPAVIFKTAADNKATITIKVNEKMSLVIDGTKITGTVSAAKITVKDIGTISGISGEKAEARIEIEGINAPALALNLGKDSAGKFANAMRVAGGAAKFAAVSVIGADGTTHLELHGSGDYVIITDTETKKPGDLNNDMVINALDAVEILKNITGNIGMNALKADYNGDGATNAMDASHILKVAAGIIPDPYK